MTQKTISFRPSKGNEKIIDVIQKEAKKQQRTLNNYLEVLFNKLFKIKKP